MRAIVSTLCLLVAVVLWQQPARADLQETVTFGGAGPAFLQISGQNLPAFLPPGHGPLTVREFNLVGAGAALSVEPTNSDPLRGWWLDPTPGAGTGPTEDKKIYSTSIPTETADDAWKNALGTTQNGVRNKVTLNVELIRTDFCATLDVSCGVTSTVTCRDWSNLTLEQREAIGRATLYAVVGTHRYRLPASRASGGVAADVAFDANEICEKGAQEASTTSKGISTYLDIAAPAAANPHAPPAGTRIVNLKAKPPRTPADQGASTTTTASTGSTPPPLTGQCELENADPKAYPYIDRFWRDMKSGEPVLIVSYAEMHFQKYEDRWQAADCKENLSTTQQSYLHGYADEPDVCFSGYQTRRDSKLGDPFFPPNTPLRVYVIHEARADASVTSPQTPGAAGLQVLPGNGVVAATGAGSTVALPGSLVSPSATHAGPRAKDHPGACLIDGYELAPRPPGPFSVVTQLLDEAGAIIPGSIRVIEMVVEQKYYGAIRVGFAASFPTYGNRSFGIHQTGAGTTTISQDEYSAVAPELVAGFTGFWQPRYASELRCTTFAPCAPEPFIAVGVTSVSPSGTFSALTSLYAGFEFQVSIITFQLMAGVHRDTVLADGYRVGAVMPTGTTTVPTVSRLDFAPAVSLTFDADLLKVAGVTLP